MICVCKTAFTIYLLFVLGGGSSCILVMYGRTTNKVTITASYSMSIFLSNHVSNAALVFYYWGLYDTSIVFSYNAKSSAGLSKKKRASTDLCIVYENALLKYESQHCSWTL
jgi:hypothetical protein